MRRDVFQAISDPVRRDIIKALTKDALSVNEIAAKFVISRPAISKHLKILKECELIEIDQHGRQRMCRLKPQSLIPAFLWIEQYQYLWQEKIDQFEKYIIKLKQKENK